MVLWQDFYEDLFEELNKYGEIESLNICDNLADHMVRFLCYFLCHPLMQTRVLYNYLIMSPVQVGNVYVQFREEEQAANALKNLTGRFYAGKFSSLTNYFSNKIFE